MKNREITIALIQHSCSNDQQANFDKATAMIRKAASKGAQIICTQELFTGTYFPQTICAEHYSLAEPIPGPTTEKMRQLAEALGVVLIVSMYEKAIDGLYFNTAVVFDADGTFLGKYRKHHIPEGPQYTEKYYFAEGDGGYPVFKTKFATIGVLICWDEWFPEASRILALKGAEMIFYPSAIGSEPDHPDLDTSEAWSCAIKAHGICNGLFVAAVNRVGKEKSNEGEMSFYGRSFVSDPFGKELAKAQTDSDECILAKLDLETIQKARHILQFHRDRRPDSYGDILSRSLV